MRLFDKWFRKSEISRADSKCHAYRFGRIDWAKSIDKSLLRIDNATEYMIRVLDMLDGLYGLAGKNVADIGGSNISKEMADHYHIKKFVCVDPVTQWYQDCGYDISKTRYANLHLVKNDDFSDAWRKHDYFIVDEPAEKLDAQYHNKFDIIVSMSTFEHVDSITNTMDNVHAMLIPGGVFYATYEPVFSCAKGHHIWIDEDLCFAKLPELDFLHLKYDKKAAIEYLKTIKKFQGHEERMAYQAFDSHVINRKTIRQHIDEIFSSRFNQYAIDFWNLDKFPDDKALDTIRGKYGNMRYDVRGVAVTAFK